MERNHQDAGIGLDRALVASSALENDKLDRKAFSESVVTSLSRIDASAGFVLSVEGAWGSGKTSTLAMIEALLNKEHAETRPVIVHFNPWLIGDRDALLRQFLAKIALAVEMADHVGDSKKVAEELKTYAKVFEFAKLIPGAEPWASIVKSVLESGGNAVSAAADHKCTDIETQKNKVEGALKKFPKRIIVFVDDLDRLFPNEVFEIVRIIKAVGDLPHVGYVLSFDPSYVNEALEKASVPNASVYLEKIVQVRMPLPILSFAARERLIENALKSLDSQARKSYFKESERRLSKFYFSGLRDLVEQPRDIVRIFNTVKMIEPFLRGEVVLADVIGLAALMVKALPVYELLRKHPRWFVGALPGDHGLTGKKQEILKIGEASRAHSFTQCCSPQAVAKIVKFLFPLTHVPGAHTKIKEFEGHIASPSRLLIAIQMSITGADVSLVDAARYLLRPDARLKIEESITPENCIEFLGALADMAESMDRDAIFGIKEICLSISRIVDMDPCVSRAKRHTFFSLSVEDFAKQTINRLVSHSGSSQSMAVASLIVMSADSLTVAMEIIVSSFLVAQRDVETVLCADNERGELVEIFSKNVTQAAKEGWLLDVCNPSFIFWNFWRISGSLCPEIFQYMKDSDPTLDAFALAILKHSFDSHKGQTYGLHDNRNAINAYCSIDELKRHASERLSDNELTFPARAAWQAVVDEKIYYGVDGSMASR